MNIIMWKFYSNIAYISVCIFIAACANDEATQPEESAPVPEIAIQCSNSNSNSLTITYTPDKGAAGYYYNLGTDPAIGTKVENDDEHSVTYSNLIPNTRYTFSAIAWNKKGKKGAVTTLHARTKKNNGDDNKTNYVSVFGQRFELLSAKMLIDGDLSTSGKEEVFFSKILRFEGEKGMTVNLQEKYPPYVVPYTEIWKSGSYSVINSQDYNVYTCTVILNSQPIYVEGTIILSCSDNNLSATIDCGNLQGHYNGKFTADGVIRH